MKYFYGRSSTARQEMSFDLQLDEVEKKFGKMDACYFDKGVSGGAPIEKRVKLIELLDVLKKGDEVYIYSFSRIARDTFLHLFIEKEVSVKGAKIISVKEEDSCGVSAEKKMMRVILSAVAEYEKSLIRARVKSSRQTMRKQGRYMGGKREYGYEIKNGGVRMLPDEQKVIEMVKGWKKEGMKMTKIQERLNDAGIPSATGSTWHYMSVRKLVKRVA